MNMPAFVVSGGSEKPHAMFECRDCRAIVKVTFEKHEDYAKRLMGAAVQDAFPYMSILSREMFVMGVCPNCCRLSDAPVVIPPDMEITPVIDGSDEDDAFGVGAHGDDNE